MKVHEKLTPHVKLQFVMRESCFMSVFKIVTFFMLKNASIHCMKIKILVTNSFQF